MPEFTHLHTHSSYSFLDGAAKVGDLAKRAGEMGMEALALTDHGYVHGLPEFYEACEDEDITPIVGFEAYMVDDVARVKEEKEQNRYHQILLAKNDKGLENLNKLASWAATKGYYYKPLIDFSRLKKHSDGLIATSSCVQSMFSQAVVKGNMERAEEIAQWFKDTFGNDFYFEVHDHGIEAERKVRDGVDKLSTKMDVDVICANDIHYIRPEDRQIQVELMSVQMERNKAQEYSHEGLHMATPQEMAELFHDRFPNALENTMAVADKIDLEMPFGREPVLPEFPVPDGFDSERDYLYHMAKENIPRRYPEEKHEEALRRLNHEIEIIDQMGYNRYFLIVQNITGAAQEMGIRVGPGRGSAAGAIVSYLLGITNTDPLKYDLIFERFLNPERVSMPDIDIDFSDHRRDEVIDWIVDEYGEDSVSQIVTFGAFKTKSAIRDMCRSIGFSVAETNQIADLVPSTVQVSEDEKLDIFLNHDGLEKKAEEDDRVKDLFDMVPRVQGMKRHTGVHACGVLITPGEVDEYMPVRLSKTKGRKVRTTQYEGDYTEDFGLLKMDILGLSTLSVIDKTLEILKENQGIEIDMEEVPEDDTLTWDLFCRGETVCIFQFESEGMQQWLEKLEPNSIDDLVAMNALYRPGPMKLIPDYIARRHGEEDLVYLHESVHDAVKDEVGDILDDTYGIMVFQEQIIKVAQRLAGFTLGEADILRRAVGKKKRKLLEKQKEKFVQGCIDQGYNQALGEEVFSLIEEFADYGFNRSHAAAYSEIAYQTAYLKAHYPSEFMAANLDVYANDKDKKAKYLAECRRMGIDVRAPNVNMSGHDFTAHTGSKGEMHVYYGLSPIKHVSDKSADDIVGYRDGDKYKSFVDFMLRHQAGPDSAVNSQVVESLVKVGAMDDLPVMDPDNTLPVEIDSEGGRGAMLAVLEEYKKWLGKLRDYRRGNRVSNPDPPEREKFDYPKATYDQYLHWEADLLGDFISGHPMDGYEPVEGLVHALAGAPPNVDEPMNPGGSDLAYPYVGYIKDVQPKKTKSEGRNKGKERADFTLLTREGTKDLNVWHDTYKDVKAHIEPGRRVVVLSKHWRPEEGRDFWPVEDIIPVDEMVADWSRLLALKPKGENYEEEFEAIKSLIGRASRGDVNTMIILDEDSEDGQYVGPDIHLTPHILRELGEVAQVELR